jgi:hypothetical protein
MLDAKRARQDSEVYRLSESNGSGANGVDLVAGFIDAGVGNLQWVVMSVAIWAAEVESLGSPAGAVPSHDAVGTFCSRTLFHNQP